MCMMIAIGKNFLYESYTKDKESNYTRKMIIDMPYTEWKKMGFSKGTLHYMKQNARSDKPFTLNAHVKERLENWKIDDSKRFKR